MYSQYVYLTRLLLEDRMKSKKGVIAIVAVAVLTVAAVVGILIKKDYGSYRTTVNCISLMKRRLR